jgi:hypothetical protein
MVHEETVIAGRCTNCQKVSFRVVAEAETELRLLFCGFKGKLQALILNVVAINGTSSLLGLCGPLTRTADNESTIISAESIIAEPLIVIFSSDDNFSIFKIQDFGLSINFAHCIKQHCDMTSLVTTLLRKWRQNNKIIMAILVAI